VIVRYTDHAVNERTFLAWVRTALTVVAFGGIPARFDLSRKVAVRPHGAATHAPHGVMTDAGLGCGAIGVVLFVAAYQRYRRTRAEIGRMVRGAPWRACWLSPLPLAWPFSRHWPGRG
jgi:putative membrane protein